MSIRNTGRRAAPTLVLDRRQVLGSLGALGAAGLLSACAGDEAGGSQVTGLEQGGPPGLPRLPRPRFAMHEVDGKRIIETNGVPAHPVGVFPNAACPFAIGEADLHFELSATPAVAPVATSIQPYWFGIALSGAPFIPTGPFWGERGSGWQFNVMHPLVRTYLGLDQSHSHVQHARERVGHYHYHSVPLGLIDAIARSRRIEPWSAPLLLGYAADGFPIYGPCGHADPQDAASPVRRLRPSYRLRSGQRGQGPGGICDGVFAEDHEFVPGLGDLDECNGRFAVTPEYPQGVYHYVVTADYPHVPRLFRGSPDPSFLRANIAGERQEDDEIAVLPPMLSDYGR